MPTDEIAAALLALVQSGEGIPLTIRVTPSDEVNQLRERIADLEADVKFWKEKLDFCQYKYGAERQIVERLINLCNDNDIRLPRDIFKR